MKISIIFHSVCGNTYLMAKDFYDCLKKQGKEVSLYRVKDDDLEKWMNIFPVAKEYFDEINNIPVAGPEVMLESEHIIIGSPTYFGNVSSEMKAYMDGASIFWIEGKLVGKKLTAFTSSSNSEGGGDLCLQAINTFAQHMGMISIPIPSNLLTNKSFPAYGFIHYSGGLGDQRPDENIYTAIKKYTEIYI
ncbi:flavodoxin family protein [Crassaminicella profunda]|uniref:flavodoxin family protein n=1 Tax=Crassaminicella profunda TaxID=1286698 RepID=UPI001CA793CB|nr:NAD(P)H-dependent oxidoreductase [Crassaminicella profunda]QZY54114.1 NAD(P)H-dependent oxidoreductase [Crassaminicella profunda]